MRRPFPARLPLVLAALVAAGTAAAQPAQPPVPEMRAVFGADPRGRAAALGADHVYAASAVDKAVMAHGRNRAPEYPPALRAEGLSGDVLVVAVVDTTGRIQMDSLTIVRATDARFVPAVRDALEGWRFQPAELGGRKVRQRVELPFAFTHAQAGHAAPGSQGTQAPRGTVSSSRAVLRPAPAADAEPAGGPDGPVYSGWAVDKAVTPRGGNPAPAYPEALRARGVEGDVLISGIVDATGRLEQGSVEVRRVSDDRFVPEVLAVLPRWRFTPAEVGGVKVRQRVDIPFRFRK